MFSWHLIVLFHLLFFEFSSNIYCGLPTPILCFWYFFDSETYDILFNYRVTYKLITHRRLAGLCFQLLCVKLGIDSQSLAYYLKYILDYNNRVFMFHKALNIYFLFLVNKTKSDHYWLNVPLYSSLIKLFYVFVYIVWRKNLAIYSRFSLKPIAIY